MKKILALLFLLFTFPALAADNAVTLTAGSGVTMRTKDIGAGVQSPFNILGDATGTAIYGTAGSANSNVLSVQGIASGTAMSVSQATAANLNMTEASAAATLAAIQGPVPTNPKTTTQTKLTVAVTNTYQQLLASSAGRTGCTIQYIAVAGTKGFVFFGSAPGDTTTSFQLIDKQTMNCNIGGVAVAQDAIQVTGTGTDIFIVSNQ